MEMTLNVHVPRRSPRPVQVVVRWSGTQPADSLRRALSTHLDMPVPALSSRGIPISAVTPVGSPPLVHGASVSVMTAGATGSDPIRRGCAPDAAQFRATARSSAVEIAVVGGPDCGRSEAVSPSGVTVGRAPGVGLRVDDESLSREHVRFTATAAGIILEDRGSTNGVVVDGCPLSGTGAIDTSTTIVVGGSTLALRRRAGAGLPVRACGDGRLAIRPTQAPEPSSATPAVQAPTHPGVQRPTRVPWVAALVPVPVAAVLAALFGPQMLAFALLGPTVMLATALGDRWGAGRAHRRDLEAYRLETERARRLLTERVAHECARRRAQHPDPHRVLVVAEHRQPGLWQKSAPGLLRIGLGDSAAETAWVEGTTSTTPVAHLVPVTVDLARAGRLGIVGDRASTDRLLGSLVGQLVVDVPPTGLRLVVSSSEDSWAWARLLPHAAAAWAVGQPRNSSAPVSRVADLVVVPDAAALDEERWAQCLREESLLIVAAGTSEALPGGCTTVLTQAPAQWSLVAADGEVSVTPDLVGSWWTDRVARALAPLRLETASGQAPSLPSSVGLPTLLGLSEITPDAVIARWSAGRLRGDSSAPSSAGHATSGEAKTSTAAPPVAPVGMGPDGPWSIDLRLDGPHVLIGGTTGSGKSEFLRTLVTSLSLSCPPEDLSFVLVDFKGGSAFGSCSGLPHVVGLVTDLDEQLVDRALRSLGAELRRRERVFAGAGARDLEDYQRRRRPTDAPVPRLVVVIDELRALVDELPDFVSGLVRLAALGRSLGVHLVLATQRPSGAITAEIQSNVNLRIAFRVRDRADSVDVLDHPGAASIPSDAPGRGMVRGGDGAVRSFHAATLSHEEDPATAFLTVSGPDLDGQAPGHALSGRHGQPSTAPFDPASAVVQAVVSAHTRTGGPPPRTPWLPPLPGSLSFASAQRRGSGPQGQGVALVDQPEQQAVTVLDPPRGSTWLLAGPPGSGRTNAARTVVLASAVRATSAELHVHVIEVMGGLADLDRLGHLGTRLRAEEHGSIRHLLDLLRTEVDARLHAPRPRTPRDVPPEMVLVVDGWEQFVEAQPESDHGRAADDLVRLLRDGGSVGVRGVVTGGRSLLQPRWAGVGADLFLLGRTDVLDAALAGVAHRDVLRDPPSGRALHVSARHHVQFALVTEADVISAAESGEAPRADRRPISVRPLPSHVSRSSVRAAPGPGHLASGTGPLLGVGEILLGVGGPDAAPVRLDPRRVGRRLAVVGPAGSGRTTALQAVARSCLAGGHRVAVVTPSPGEWQGLPGCLVTSPAAPERLVELRLRHPALVLLVDDAHRLDGTAAEQVVREVIDLVDRDHGVVVVATTPRAVAARFRGVDVEVCREQAGLLLCPDVGDGDALGIRGLHSVPRIAGRGVLVARGTTTEVQVFAPERSSVDVGLVGPRLGRLHVGPGDEGEDRRDERDAEHRPAQGGASGLSQVPADGQQEQVPHDGRGAGPFPLPEPTSGEDEQRHSGSGDEHGRDHHPSGVTAGADRELVEVEQREPRQDRRLRPGDEGGDAAGVGLGVQ